MFNLNDPMQTLAGILSVLVALTIGEAANQLRIRSQVRARRRAFLEVVAVECALNSHSNRVRRERRLARR